MECYGPPPPSHDPFQGQPRSALLLSSSSSSSSSSGFQQPDSHRSRRPSRSRSLSPWGMTKVHPNAATPAVELPTPAVSCRGGAEGRQEPAVLTVWRKSLLFNCSGFTVYDAKGCLVFRVDNYGSGSKGEIVLMDAAGKPLLTIRRKKLSLGDHWLIYNGEEAVNSRFSVKRHLKLLHSKALAHVAPCGAGRSGGAAGYEVEGSYSQRSCSVYDEQRRPVAEIRPKEPAARGVAFGADVFRLVVQPDLDATLAMAIVIALDQMFGPRGSLING